jgi:hypothetical protein
VHKPVDDINAAIDDNPARLHAKWLVIEQIYWQLNENVVHYSTPTALGKENKPQRDT